MAVNFSTAIYLPTYAVFARPVTFTPKVSQPLAIAYLARGIYTSQPVDILTESPAIFSDALTILDIIEAEFTILPVQGDEVFIPSSAGIPEAGNFVIIDTDANGGGETTLTLRRIVTSKP